MSKSVHRSAATGRFVQTSTAARSPRTTVAQHVPSRTDGAYRSAITGRYVSAATAHRHPGTTIHEGK